MAHQQIGGAKKVTQFRPYRHTLRTATTFALPITLCTHNGKPLDEGGKRTGYKVGNTFFPVGGGQVSLVPTGEKVSKPLFPVFEGYNALPVVRLIWSGRVCFYCRNKDLSSQTVTVDGEQKLLYTCDDCSKHMRV